MFDPSIFPVGAPQTGSPADLSDEDAPILSPVPSLGQRPTITSSSSLTPLVCDERAIAALLGNLLEGSGLTISAAAKKLGINPASLRQYINGRRGKPSLLWFVRFASLCGAKVTIEFPKRGR